MAAPIVAYASSPFDAPFFTGSPSSTELVPGIFHIAIDGHPYLVDLSHGDVETIQGWFREETIPLLRPQQDGSTELGEQSISPDPAWRKAQETWHKGAGQIHFDRKDSDQARFHSSKGIDPWEKWKLTLLEDTALKDAFAGGSGSSVIVVNPTGTPRAYASSGGNNLRTSPDPLSVWSAVTGIPGTNCTSLATDGVNVYSAWGTNRIYVTDANATPTVAAAYVTSGNPVSLVAYLKGRLIAAHLDKLYEITASGALPAPFFDHPNANWVWTGLAEGPGFIYAAGMSGSYSTVYKIVVEKETTALAIGTAALTGLPLGETVQSIYGALGFIFLGTNRGVRFCSIADNGDLQVGSLIETGFPVRDFTSWDRFVYFTWENFDAASSGVGRLDPSSINQSEGEALVPAYASDVMASVAGVVNAVAVVPSTSGHAHPVFTIDGSGVWRCIPDQPVASGTLTTGLITYGIADQKIAAFLDIRHEALPVGTSIAAALAADDTSPVGIGVSSAPGSVGPSPLGANQKRGELFELTFTLNGKVTATFAEPTLRRWTLRSIPAPVQPSSWTIPLLFEERLLADYDHEYSFDPLTELTFLRDLRQTKRIVTFQWGVESFPVVVDAVTFLVDRNTGSESVPNFNWTGRVFVTLNQVIA